MRRACKKEAAAIEWYRQAAKLPPDWDTGLPVGHFLGRDTLTAHEQAKLPHLQTIYAGFYRQGALVARAAFQILTLQPGHINPTALKGWQRTAWQLFAKVVRPRLLVAGQLFRHDISSFFWTDALTPFEAFNLYRRAISSALSDQCAQAVLVKEPPEALVPYFQHYAPEYLLLRNDSSMQLQLPADWRSFTHYEHSLKHKYAQRLRKVRQSWQDLMVRELQTAEVEAEQQTLYRLYLQVTEHQPVRLGLLSAAFLPRLKAFYGDKLKVWGIYEDGQMVAFASAWVQPASFDMFYIGFDYARNSELQLYFNVLFFAIEQAIALQKPQLILGRTALEAKARVGCRPVYLNTFLYVRNGLLRGIVRRMQQQLAAPAGEWENRHPFKKELPE